MLALRVPAVHTLDVHACVMRACTSHARVACTCCACPCCACPRCAPSCGVWCACAARSSTACEARRHCTPVDPGDLPCPLPFPPVLSLICLLLSCIVPPSLPHFLLVLFLPFVPFFACVVSCPLQCSATSCGARRRHRLHIHCRPGRPDTLSVTYDSSCLSIFICLQCCTEGPLHAPQCSCMRLCTAVDLEEPWQKWLA